MSDEQHGSARRGVAYRDVDRVERLVQGEVLVHPRAVAGKIDSDGRDALVGEELELRAPHRRGRADAVHEDDLDAHAFSIEKGGAGG